MDALVSSWYNVQSLPNAYVIPPERRPGKVIVPPGNTIPVIDLEKPVDRAEMIRQILQACREFGFFHVINHGVAHTLMDDTMNMAKEFFGMPLEDKASLFSQDSSRSNRLYTSSINYENEEAHYWRDGLRLPCHPLEECIHLWPEKPTRYREVVGKYSVEVRKVGMRLLEMITEGLGLEPGFLVHGEVAKAGSMTVNHYPRCPDPSMALGVYAHCDAGLMTFLHQDEVSGLQVLKDGQWIAVEPVPHAFVVNLGYQLQIHSNDKLTSAIHRAVTNSSTARTSIATFIEPESDTVIEPAKALINDGNPPLYRAFEYKEFLHDYIAYGCQPEKMLVPYKLQA